MSAFRASDLTPAKPTPQRLLAAGVYALFAAMTAYATGGDGHPEAWLALLATPVVLLVRSSLAVAAALVAGGAWLRFVMGLATEPIADQLWVSQAAAARVLAGGTPYGVGYDVTVPPGAPFVYGPLMLIWGAAGTWGEAAASVATLGLIAWTRSWVTLAGMAAFPLFVIITSIGINDSAPGFFITAGVLAMRHRPIVGGVLIAVAAALKPYAFAWLPGLIGYGGVRAGASAAVASLVAWAPVAAWGPASVVRSFEMARDVHQQSAGALNMPALRVLAAPVALAALFARSWEMAALSGSAIFVIVLFLDTWASFGYWLAVLPITGIAIEQALIRRGATRAGAARHAVAEAVPGS